MTVLASASAAALEAERCGATGLGDAPLADLAVARLLAVPPTGGGVTARLTVFLVAMPKPRPAPHPLQELERWKVMKRC
ncbi:hypothetical protein DT603_00570 [Pseudoxanthomonas gei]|uniref:Uncharacterized protein n=1 Tax=Pseudoxanthomonas gei TaxID=1383030 RepID=A0ABX0A8U2_9GAMM|nr:hypothetical protein [Pseudoxanthomonas gei]